MPAADPRFFQRAGPHRLGTLASVARAEIVAPAGGADPAERLLSGIAPLQTATAEHISFLDNRKYLPALRETRAGAVIVHPDLRDAVPATAIALLAPATHEAWARVAAQFHPLPPAVAGVHPSAVVDPAAEVDPSAEIGPLAVIGAGARIGPRCRIAPHAVIGAGVVLGPDCRIGAHASLSHALLGARVYVYPGARIGQEGYGFAVTPAGFLSVPQVGLVVLEDDVEVGANSTVDRGSLQDTVIGAGSRLDNLVQIGHNVRVGRACAIVAQVGVAGSAVIEDFVMIGGQAGIVGHIRIGAGAKIAAQSGVMAGLDAGAEVGGTPAQPLREVFRQIAAVRKLASPRGRGTAKTSTD
jgi:UDP-3-O-[3-hydroxymyristoyl] glucosamine N-acyltransferase